jgi:hypothetical protein
MYTYFDDLDKPLRSWFRRRSNSNPSIPEEAEAEAEEPKVLQSA